MRRHTDLDVRHVLVCALITMLGASVAGPAFAETELEQWLRRYDAAPVGDPSTGRVSGIVRELLKTSPFTHVGPSRVQGVYVLDVPDGSGVGGAKMLKSRDVLVDARLIRLADEIGGSSEKADVLLAFVLAHELMHLVDEEIASVRLSSSREVTAWRETTADIWAVRLMAFAGYDIDWLAVWGEHFVDRWALLTGEKGLWKFSHKRMVEVTNEVARIRARLALFRIGLRWYELGAFRFALGAFQAYTPPFPAPEALHAEGIARLRLALFLLRQCVGEECPGRAEALGCWPLLVPPRSPRAEVHHGISPVRSSPSEGEVLALVRDARSLLEAANNGYGGSPDVFMALAVAELLHVALTDPQASRSMVTALLDKAERHIVGRGIEVDAQRARLAVMRLTVRHLEESSADLGVLLDALAGVEIGDADRRCLRCLYAGGCAPSPSTTPRSTTGSVWRDLRLEPQLTPGQALARLGRLDAGPVSTEKFSVGDAGTMQIDTVDAVEWRPTPNARPVEADIDLVFLNERLVLAQWTPREKVACMTWENARVVDQLATARAILRMEAGEGQQCQGGLLLTWYVFDASALSRVAP